MLSLETAAGEKKKGSVRLCLIFILCAVLTGLLVARVNTETHYSFVAGAAAIPALLFLASPAALLLKRRPLVGYALLIALQFFPCVAFAAYRINPAEPAFFYIADANFTGFSPERFSWWQYGRFMGLVLQLAGFASLMALAAAKIVPEHFLTAAAQENRRKMFVLAAVFVLVMFGGLFAIVRAF